MSGEPEDHFARLWTIILPRGKQISDGVNRIAQHEYVQEDEVGRMDDRHGRRGRINYLVLNTTWMAVPGDC